MLPIPLFYTPLLSSIPSYNPPPGSPIFWFDPSLGDMATDRIGNLTNLKSSFVYPSTKNGLMVASSSTNTSGSFATGSVGSYTTTIFIVCNGMPAFNYWYDVIPGDAGPGGGLSYNLGLVRTISETDPGTGIVYNKAGNSWAYNGTYPTETYSSSAVSIPVVSGWSIIYFKSQVGSTSTTSGRINGVTMSSVAGISMNIPSYSLPSNVSLSTSLDGATNYGDVIVYNTSLSSTDIDLVESYLKSKWGISYYTTNMGYNNVDNNSRYVGYYKFTITNVSTTNIGIKIPISSVISSSLGSTTNITFNLQRASVVGLTPSILSSTGWPTGFARASWTSTSDSNYIYISTSNSTQKSALSVGESYWFGFKLDNPSGSPSYQFNESVSNVILTDSSLNCRYESYLPRSGDFIGTYSVSILDYNS